MLRKRVLTAIAIAAFAGMLPAAAQAATPKANCFIAWQETQSVIYMVNQVYDTDELEWELAFEANASMSFAFYELHAIENRNGGSYEVARDHLDDALNALFWLSSENIPRNVRSKVESAQRYGNWARSGVDKMIQSGK